MSALRVLAHPDDFLPVYNQLQSQPQINKAMLEAIDNVKQQLERSDKPLGAHHKKKQIPQYYKTRYNLQALYHFDMPDFHRLMYTVRRSPVDGKIEAIFLELLTHEQYNSRFGYFKKKSH
ncbi:MAG TPA: hypothetical protein VNK07_00230 [Candidatus Binatia bacterium]|nr:hypothetical protein [Candidatus Binatia bacterium]